MQSRIPPLPLKHNFGYWDLPAYYGNWFAFASGASSKSQYEQWFNEVGRREAESALLRGLARSSSDRLVVLGGQPWLYIESGLLPATRYVAVCSSSCIVPSGSRRRTPQPQEELRGPGRRRRSAAFLAGRPRGRRLRRSRGGAVANVPVHPCSRPVRLSASPTAPEGGSGQTRLPRRPGRE